METTVIGSYPKPLYLNIPDWFKTKTNINVTHDTNKFITDW